MVMQTGEPAEFLNAEFLIGENQRLQLESKNFF
jgi:hypothetical protein